jgi:5-methylcytosine-specific restriction endonuclease McrA
MPLPESRELPINLLAACFNKKAATYKFYWLLSILQSVENGFLKIKKKELFSRMISNSWFTVNYFNVSFGKQDLIQDTIRSINKLESITIDEKKEIVFQKLLSPKNAQTERLLWHFNNNVPHWFLTPWFPKIGNESDAAREKRIYNESQNFNSKCLYGLHQDYIEINPEWANYLRDNAKLLKDYCFWNLALFLQSKNPNVPDIPNKLIKPASRNGLKKQRSQFWDIAIDELGSVECIYTGKKLIKGDYAIEHFIPYSFVSHDLMWNLIPADKSFNSSKSNKLPVLDRYFEPFYNLQKNAFEIVRRKTPNNKLLEDYLTVLQFDQNSFNQAHFKEVIQPLVSIASNNGFEFMK